MANLTRTRQAVIVEPLRPERFFVRTFNATSLYILSICEVCGSYQCPYCPFYSAAPPTQLAINWALAAALLVSHVFFNSVISLAGSRMHHAVNPHRRTMNSGLTAT